MWPRAPAAPLDCRAAPSRVRGRRTELTSRDRARTRTRDGSLGRGAAGLILSLLVAPLVLLLAPPANAVGTLCLPSPTSACIAGTLRTESGVLPGVDVTVKNVKSGEEQTATTGDDGKWNVTVKEEGTYDVSIAESELPKDVVTKGKVTVDGQVRRHGRRPDRDPDLVVRRRQQQGRRADAELGQRHPPRPAARPGLGRAVADLRHHRPVELRARRAGHARRHPRLLPDQPARARPSRGRRRRRRSSAPSPAGSRTGSCGSRCGAAGWG